MAEHDRPLHDAAAEDLHVGLHHVVDQGEAVEGGGQEGPGPQTHRQAGLVVELELVEGRSGDPNDAGDGDHDVEEDGVDQGEAVDGDGQKHEGSDEVESEEPLVLEHLGAPELGGEKGEAGEGDDVEEDDTGGVYDDMDHGHLEGLAAVARAGAQSCQDPGEREQRGSGRQDDRPGEGQEGRRTDQERVKKAGGQLKIRSQRQEDRPGEGQEGRRTAQERWGLLATRWL